MYGVIDEICRYKNKIFYYYVWIFFLNNIKLKWILKIMIKVYVILDLLMYILLIVVYDFNDELGIGKLIWDIEGEVFFIGYLYNVF